MIAMVAGCFPVRIGRSKSSFAAGEVFIFLLLLMHGPYAATLAAGCETAVGALRTSKRWTSRIASPTISALAMFVAGSALHAGLGALTRADLANDGLTVVATMLFSLLYFTANSVLVSSVLRLKRNERLTLSDWFGVFGWVGIAMAGSAAVASLLFLSYQQSGLGVLAAMVPIMATLLATLHDYHRQEEASEAMRQAAADAATRAAEAEGRSVARENEIAQQHLQQLQASEQRFQSAFTHASIGMALLSFEGQILQANDALRELLGLDDTQLLKRSFQSFVVDADRLALGEQLARMSARQIEDFSLEMRVSRTPWRRLG